MRRISWTVLVLVGTCLGGPSTRAADGPILFNSNFEGGSIGKIEVLGPNEFRCQVQGQYDEHGRNRQASWYYFRMDGVKDRAITLTLSDLVGEYNATPGACPMNADTIPVFSDDNVHWRHFAEMGWDDAHKTATLHLQPKTDRIWIAHLPPYPHSRLLGLLEEINGCPSARIEVVGKTVRGRDLHMVTVTNLDRPDQGKKVVWLQARQHAWEAATSYVMEGALRFITSDEPLARTLRDQVVFVFTPMLDPDGAAAGMVRFNANGYDVNRHWDEVDLRLKEYLQQMPEIWYVKKAILGFVDAGRPIDLMVNMHNTESNEYMESLAQGSREQALMTRFQQTLIATTSFDPTATLTFEARPDHTANALWGERKVPIMLMEQRIGTNRKLNRRLTERDRLAFGRELLRIMAESVLGNAAATGDR